MLITTWLLYTAFGLAVFCLVFLWAVRTQQFRGQDEARYLPLADAPSSPPTRPGSRVGVWILGSIVVVAAGIVVATVVLSLLAGAPA